MRITESRDLRLAELDRLIEAERSQRRQRKTRREYHWARRPQSYTGPLTLRVSPTIAARLRDPEDAV